MLRSDGLFKSSEAAWFAGTAKSARAMFGGTRLGRLTSVLRGPCLSALPPCLSVGGLRLSTVTESAFSGGGGGGGGGLGGGPPLTIIGGFLGAGESTALHHMQYDPWDPSPSLSHDPEPEPRLEPDPDPDPTQARRPRCGTCWATARACGSAWW